MNYPAVIENPLLKKLKSKPDLQESKRPNPKFQSKSTYRVILKLRETTFLSNDETSEAFHW